MDSNQELKTKDLELFCRKGIGPVTYQKYLIYETLPEFNQKDFNIKYPIDKSLLDKIVSDSSEFVTFRSFSYPLLLKETADCPVVLFYKGDLNLLNETQLVGIAGTRNPTDYGISICKDLVKRAGKHISLVTGLALGVDTIIAEECIRNNIKVIGVIPANIKNVVPNSNKQLVDKILNNGGLVLWENPLQEVTNGSFIQRNRIIAGVSNYLVVVEADENSGSITTADFACDYNRDVYSIPGKIYSSKSKGTNTLIKENKAKIVTKFEDLPGFGTHIFSSTINNDKVDNIERKLYYAILDEPKGLDDLLILVTDYSILISKLLNLELLGYIKKGHDGKYRKN